MVRWALTGGGQGRRSHTMSMDMPARAGSALPAAPTRARSVLGLVAWLTPKQGCLSRAAYGLVASSKRSASSRA
jgi:hypothetical protein